MHGSPEAKPEFSSTKTKFCARCARRARLLGNLRSSTAPCALTQLSSCAQAKLSGKRCTPCTPCTLLRISLTRPISFCGFPCGFLLSQRQELCGLLRCLMTACEAADSRRQGDAPGGPEKGSERPWFGYGGRAEVSGEAEGQASLEDLDAADDHNAGRHRRRHPGTWADSRRRADGSGRVAPQEGCLTRRPETRPTN